MSCECLFEDECLSLDEEWCLDDEPLWPEDDDLCDDLVPTSRMFNVRPVVGSTVEASLGL
jgi:hypothetical protein